MNNKRGGIGAKILVVLILMLISAGGGAYGYSILDGKLAVRDANKDIEMVRVSDYDTAEAATVESLIEDTKKNLESAKTRKDVYEIMENFNDEISKIKTKTQKELEEAKKEAEEAKNNRNNNNDSNYNDSYDYDDPYNNDYGEDNASGNNRNDSNSNDNSSGTNNNNSNGNAITNDDGSSGRDGLLGGLLNKDN
jgi:hypothetical protein